MSDENLSAKLGLVQVFVPHRESVNLTLTITLPIHAWQAVAGGGYWNTFEAAVQQALTKFASITGEAEVQP